MTKTTSESEKNRITTNFEKFFETNQSIKDPMIELQLKLGHPPIKRRKSQPYLIICGAVLKKNKSTNQLRKSIGITKYRRRLFRIPGRKFF